MIFKRKDYRDRHERTTCPQNPSKDQEEESPSGSQLQTKKRKRAPRGSKVRSLPPDSPFQPKGSDYGILPYRRLEEQHAKCLPRLHLDPAKPDSLEKDTIYKGELYCRYPECTHHRRYSEPTKLRVHYLEIHSLVYQASSPGHLNAADRKLHEDGLEWLARYAQLGEEESGERPQPIRK